MDNVKNFAKVTLLTGIDSDDLSLTLASGHGAKLPNPTTDGPFNLVCYNASDYADPADDPYVEVFRCTARVTDACTISRAQEGTSAVAHNSTGKTYKCILAFTKKSYDDLDKMYEATLDYVTNQVTVTITGFDTTLHGVVAMWGVNADSPLGTPYIKSVAAGSVIVASTVEEEVPRAVVVKVYKK